MVCSAPSFKFCAYFLKWCAVVENPVKICNSRNNGGVSKQISNGTEALQLVWFQVEMAVMEGKLQLSGVKNGQ